MRGASVAWIPTAASMDQSPVPWGLQDIGALKFVGVRSSMASIAGSGKTLEALSSLSSSSKGQKVLSKKKLCAFPILPSWSQTAPHSTAFKKVPFSHESPSKPGSKANDSSGGHRYVWEIHVSVRWPGRFLLPLWNRSIYNSGARVFEYGLYANMTHGIYTALSKLGRRWTNVVKCEWG